MFKNKVFWLIMIGIVLVIAACSGNEEATENSESNGENEEELAYNPPSMDDLDPDDPMTEAIEYGEEIFNETNTVLPDNVGNKMSCASCHADGGLAQDSSMVRSEERRVGKECI